MIAVKGRNGHVEEEAVQNGRWDVGQRIGQQEDGKTDEDVGEQSRKASFTYFHDSVGERKGNK